MRERLLHASHLGEENADVVVGDGVTESKGFELADEDRDIITKQTGGRVKLLCSSFRMTRPTDLLSAHSRSKPCNLH